METLELKLFPPKVLDGKKALFSLPERSSLVGALLVAVVQPALDEEMDDRCWTRRQRAVT
jgi:hypothetical protein